MNIKFSYLVTSKIESMMAGKSYYPISSQPNFQKSSPLSGLNFTWFLENLFPLELGSQTSYPLSTKVKAGDSAPLEIHPIDESKTPCYKITGGPGFLG